MLESGETTNMLQALSLWLAGNRVISVSPSGKKLVFKFERDWKLSRDIGYYEKKQLRFDPERWIKGMRDFSRENHIDWSKWA